MPSYTAHVEVVSCKPHFALLFYFTALTLKLKSDVSTSLHIWSVWWETSSI